MGQVYRAFDPFLRRDVAVKVPHEAALDSPQAVARFLREPQAAAQLRHPHIVPVYDAGTDQGRYYIASAFIEGRTLEQLLANGRPDSRRAAEIVLDLADALHYAHGLGIVHRDVKPANIMLDPRGDALLVDFGLARLQTGEKLTHDGTVLGTPAYMAPEQAGGALGEVGPASDQYSLGVVLYELLCGERPFHGHPAVVVFHVINEQPRAPRAIQASVPRDLETIALKAMAKRPAERYADCRVLADDLRRWLEDRPIQARQMGSIERTLRWAKARPALASLTGALLVSAVVSSCFAFALERRGVELTHALADAQAHAQRVARANATIRERDASLQQREAALETAQDEVAKTQQTLEGERQQVAAKEEELKRRLDENKRLAGQRDDARSAKEIAENTASDATKARDEIVQSDTGWAFYKRKLLAAQAALQQDNKAEAITLLRTCPKEHRGWEWKVLWSRSNGVVDQWSWRGGDRDLSRGTMSVWRGGDQENRMVFSSNGKILAVQSYTGKTIVQNGKRTYSKEDVLTLLDSQTGAEVGVVPGSGPFALHPDGNTIAMVTAEAKIIEHRLDAGADAELISMEPKQIEWIGYHPDGRHLYLVERGVEEIIVRTVDRPSRQLAKVATLAAPKNDGRDSRHTVSTLTGNFTPDSRFFLFFHRGGGYGARSALDVEKKQEFTLDYGNWSEAAFLRDHQAPELGAPSDLSRKVLAQAQSTMDGFPIAFSPDVKRLVCAKGYNYGYYNRDRGSLAVWNITPPDPQLWQHAISLSGGVFPTTIRSGTEIVFSNDWMRVAFRTRNLPDPENPKLKTRRMQVITVESWREPGPEAADDERGGDAEAKKRE